MAERLTKKISKTIQDKYSLGSYLYYDFAEIDDTNKLLNKLGKLEDILEEYGIESIEMLEQELKISREIERLKNKEFDFGNSAIVDKDFYKDFTREIEKLETDRDTWKRARELACRHIAEVEWLSCPETDDISESENEIRTLTKQSLYYFYQQAKKEKENETNDTNKLQIANC